MRHTHQTQLSRTFTIRYWAVVAVMLGGPLALIAALAAGAGSSPLGALVVPWVIAVGVAGLLAWRWSAHRLEVTTDAVVERRHPLIWYQRRRTFDEIVEVTACPPERRGVEHGESALLLRCEKSQRDLVVCPANTEQFLDDVHAADPTLERYRGRVVRRSDARAAR